MNKKQQGFSLIELMVVLTMIGIVAALAVPTFGTMIKEHQKTSTTENYYTAIRFARTEAVRSGLPVVVEPINNQWSDGLEVKSVSVDGAGVIVKEVLRRVKGNDLLTVSEANGASSIDFNGKGYLAAQIDLTFCDGQLAKKARQISVLVSGFTSVEKVTGC